MGAPDRPPVQHLSFLREAAAHVRRLAPLALLRGAEARAPSLPRIGEARLPAHNVVDLAQTPGLAFPAASLEAIRVGERRARVEGYWLGLTGPMAPLPLHLTEFAAYEQRYSKSHPYGRFLDVAAGRMLQFFYRAWAGSAPAASVDRPKDDRFGDMLAALSGAEDGVGEDTPFPARARLHYAGLYASPRSAAGIADALTHLLRTQVRVVEYVPRWRDVEPGDRSRIGRGFASLGRDVVAGGRVRTLEDAFRVVVSVSTAREYAEFLPDGGRYALLAEALHAFAPPHLDWDVELEVAVSALRAARLDGRARLGWTGSTGPLPTEGVRRDARFGPRTRSILKKGLA
jgi:type VI secretion system protein ImpH